MSLQSQLNQIASSFTRAVIEAIREISLEELVAETGGLKGMPRVPTTAAPRARGRGRASRRAATTPSRRPSSRRLKRRSQRDIDKALGDIVSLVGNRPRGMRAE